MTLNKYFQSSRNPPVSITATPVAAPESLVVSRHTPRPSSKPVQAHHQPPPRFFFCLSIMFSFFYRRYSYLFSFFIDTVPDMKTMITGALSMILGMFLFILKRFFNSFMSTTITMCCRTHSNSSVHMTSSPSDRDSAVSLTSRNDSSQISNMTRERGKSGITLVNFRYFKYINKSYRLIFMKISNTGHGSSSSKSRDSVSATSQQQQLMAQLAAAGGFDHHSAAAMQALQHQIFRGSF